LTNPNSYYLNIAVVGAAVQVGELFTFLLLGLLSLLTLPPLSLLPLPPLPLSELHPVPLPFPTSLLVVLLTDMVALLFAANPSWKN